MNQVVSEGERMVATLQREVLCMRGLGGQKEAAIYLRWGMSEGGGGDGRRTAENNNSPEP